MFAIAFLNSIEVGASHKMAKGGTFFHNFVINLINFLFKINKTQS